MTTTETQPTPLAQLATAVRKLHADGWTWHHAKGEYRRGDLTLTVGLGEQVTVEVWRRTAGSWTGLLPVLDVQVWADEASPSIVAVLVGLIAGLS